MGGKATVLWCRYSHQRDHWGRAVDGGWVFGMGDGRGWLQDTLRFCTHRNTSASIVSPLRPTEVTTGFQLPPNAHTYTHACMKYSHQMERTARIITDPRRCPPSALQHGPLTSAPTALLANCQSHHSPWKDTRDTWLLYSAGDWLSQLPDPPPPCSFIHSYPDWVE